MGERYKNTSTVPITLEDGRTVAPGEWVDVSKLQGATKDAVDAGHLIKPAKATKGASRPTDEEG